MSSAFAWDRAVERGTNQRFICGLYAGKPTVVAMREQWPESKPYTYFTEASGKVTLPFVAPLATAQCGFSPLPPELKQRGYFAEIAIPWNEIGYTPAEGASFPFDLQIIRANPSGTGIADTAWWHSTGSGPLAIYDLPTFARLYPKAWGTATLFATDPVTHTPPPPQKAGEEEIFTGPGEAVTFTLPRDARASLIIRRDDGWVVRELLRAKPMPYAVSGEARPDGSAKIVAAVLNNGGTSITPSIINIRRDGDGQPVLASASVPSLGAGESAQIAIALPAGTQPDGEAAYVVEVVPASSEQDGVPTNNTSSSRSICRQIGTVTV